MTSNVFGWTFFSSGLYILHTKPLGQVCISPMNYAVVSFSNLNRRFAWPKECGDVQVIDRVIRDACEIPADMKLRFYQDREMKITLNLERILNCDLSQAYIEIEDKVEISKFYPYAYTLFEFLSPPHFIKEDRYGYTNIPDVESESNSAETEQKQLLLHDTKFSRESQGSQHHPCIERQREFRGSAFQNQLIKFTRILAHLVNERTFLAWLRTDLALLSLSFKYLKLANKYYLDETNFAALLLFFCGGVMIFAVPITWYSAVKRFQTCRDMLDFDITRITDYLHIMGFDYDNISFGVVILSSFICIVFVSSLIIWTSS